MKLYQLNHTGQWVTQNAVTDDVADRIVAHLSDRGRQGKSWRLIDPNHIGPVKRAARPVKKAPDSLGKPEPKPRVRKAKSVPQPGVQSAGEGTSS